MLDVGVNFLTFERIEDETLKALSKTLHNPWEAPDESDPSDEETSQESLSNAILGSIGNQPLAEETAEQQKALETLLSNSVVRMIGAADGGRELQESREADEHQQPQAKTRKKRRRKGSSSTGKRKKPKTPAVVTGEYLTYKEIMNKSAVVV